MGDLSAEEQPSRILFVRGLDASVSDEALVHMFEVGSYPQSVVVYSTDIFSPAKRVMHVHEYVRNALASFPCCQKLQEVQVC